jgi:23S rRNA-/tRNA-specific pseudouridylate synthase
VHATGRYLKNSLIEILVNDFGFPKVFSKCPAEIMREQDLTLEFATAVNRLDRLTSGCMIIALTSRRAKLLCEEFVQGHVRKEYIARCLGKFPEYGRSLSKLAAFLAHSNVILISQ